MSVDKRYRKCNCGADMSISVVRDSDSGELTGVVWDNCYPGKRIGDKSEEVFRTDRWGDSVYSKTVYCQMCHKRRIISTFAK